MNNYKANKTGRSSNVVARSRDREKTRQWKDEPFVQLGLSFFNSPAWRALTSCAQRVFYRLLIEHMDHAGKENGRLPCTYSDFERYGIRRKSISKALDELEALGFVQIVRKGHLRPEGESGAPSLYRLNCYHTFRPDGVDEATDEWRRFSNIQEAISAVSIFHVSAKAQRTKKYVGRQKKS